MSAEAAFDTDISFGGDEFLLDTDELALADLMDDLDHDKESGNGNRNERGKEKDSEDDDDEDIPLSWTPTPPKVVKTTTPTPLSPLSPLSRFSSTARITGATRSFKSASIVKQTSTSNPFVTSNYSSSSATTPIKIPDSPVPSFRASTTAAAAATTSSSTFMKSPPRNQPEFRNPPRMLMVSSQESAMTRPVERDTVDSRDWGASSKPQTSAGHLRDQESRGLSRSKSSPNAGASAGLPTRNKRKLPGPAGNLPRLSAEEKEQLFRSRGVPLGKSTRIPDTASTSPNSSIKKKMKSVSQGPIDSMFSNSAWEEMLKANGLPKVKGSSPLLEITIADIEERQDLHRGKIPWLVVMIKDFTPSEIDAAVTLMDPSGEMRGTVHISVLDQYKNNEIRIGTVLVLKDVSLFSPTPVSHYLIILSRNIRGLYQPGPPTIILSQGSSQDRHSQKRRRLITQTNNSQEGSTTQDDAGARRSAASPQPAGASSHHPNSSRQFQPTSPDWGSTPEDLEGAIRSNGNSSGGASQEFGRPGSARSNSQSQSQEKGRPSLLSSLEGTSRGGASNRDSAGSQPEEVIFQSLRQTLGSSMRPTADLQDDALATPLITLGAMTPTVDAIGGGSGSRFLSSFAASPTLRKRSSQSSSAQQSKSSGSDSKSRPKSPRQTRDTILSPQRSASQGSHRTEANSSMDWPDDFPLTELDGDSDDEPALPHKQPMPANNQTTHSPSTSRPAPPPVATHRHTIHDDGDEDDLDHLLDGMDEAELFNFDPNDNLNL
ncbi:hypothetical protein BGX29_008229 [Mortierella sp. GBA35]|nr:hypothetical protein BGX29_008229 [Mortierella sp. GBA35]